MPLNNILNQLVLSENGKSVENVFIDGKAVVLEGHVQTVQEKNILAKLTALAPRIQAARQRVLGMRAQ